MSRNCWAKEKYPISFRDRIRMVRAILLQKKLEQGKKVAEFEAAWNSWLGSPYSVFVSSGSTAAFLLVSSVVERLHLKPGDKVLLSALGPISNVMPLLRYGLIPVFCDVNLKDFSFDKVELARIAKDHQDIKLVFVQHPFGLPASHNVIRSYFPSLPILDDCSESVGAIDLTESKVGAGSFGAIFSFGMGRHITTIQGGMVSTSDPGLYEALLKKRAHGLALSEEASTLMNIVTEGYNFQNTDVLAALGLSQLQRLDNNIHKRRDHFSVFYSILDSHCDFFYPLPEHPGNSCFSMPMICKDIGRKRKLISLLKNKGIPFRPLSGNILRQPFLEKDLSRIIRTSSYRNANIVHDLGICLANSDSLKMRHFISLDDILLDMT